MTTVPLDSLTGPPIPYHLVENPVLELSVGGQLITDRLRESFQRSPKQVLRFEIRSLLEVTVEYAEQAIPSAWNQRVCG